MPSYCLTDAEALDYIVDLLRTATWSGDDFLEAIAVYVRYTGRDIDTLEEDES